MKPTFILRLRVTTPSAKHPICGMKPNFYAAIVFLVFASAGLAAEPRNPFDVPDHLAETWWTDAEQEAFFTNHVPIDAKLAKVMLENLSPVRDTNNPYQTKRHAETVQHLTNKPPFISMLDLGPFSRLTNDALRKITVELGNHTNVAIQFEALLALAGTGDRNAAESILKFAQRKDLSSNDIAVLKNMFHGMGIDPLHDSAAFIVDMAKKEASDDDFDRDKLPAGSTAPDFEIKTLDGKAIHLSDYRGKTVLLHFWSTSCGPCIGEFPEMTKALRELRERRSDFVVLAVSLDDSRKTIENSVKKYDLTEWTHLCDGRGWASVPARLYHIMGIPNDVIIDPKGIIRADNWRHLEGMLKTFDAGK